MKKVIFTLILIAAVISGVPLCAGGKAEVYAAAAEIRLPVLMYHSILNSKSGVYIVSEEQFESDIKGLAALNYSFVLPEEAIAYAEGRGNLPEKPIMITFDDGHYNTMYYALPILRKYNGKAVVNVIGAFSEYSSTSGDDSNPNYSHLTWEQIKFLRDSEIFEIGNHTYDMHKFKPRYGIMPKPGESGEDYEKALAGDAGRLQDKLAEYGVYPKVFAYPFGRYSDTAREILLGAGFKMFLTCNEGVSVVKFGDPGSVFAVKRINRRGNYSTDAVLEKIAPTTPSAR